jgi:anti-repressor protein
MNTQMIIKEFQTKQITMIKDDDMNVWFNGRDVATILGYANTKQAIHMHVDSDDKLKICELNKNYNATPNTIFINEFGLHCLIYRSNIKASKPFKKWVTSEVLPSIRKTGTYTMPTKDTRAYIEDAIMIQGISNAKIQMLLNDRLANDLQGPKKQSSQSIELRRLQIEETNMIYSIDGMDYKLKQAFVNRLISEIRAN